MLKWAVSSRLNGEFYEHDTNRNSDHFEILTLRAITEQHQLPCLVRLMTDDATQPIDNYCLLLGETSDPYLIVSNETERFSIPVSFDGLFASVERGITRYNTFQSIRAIQSAFTLCSSPSSSTSSTQFMFTHFTTLQPLTAYNNAARHRLEPGALLEPSSRPIAPTQSPSPSTSTNRLRSLFANFPRSINKHSPNHQHNTRTVKNQSSSNEYIEIKSNDIEENLILKSDSTGVFIPVFTKLPATKFHSRLELSSGSSLSSNRTQGLYTIDLLSKLTDQYPLIIELIVSRTLEENISSTGGYPLRRITLHRLVEKHPRVIAFDMKNYAFIEIDALDSSDLYAIEHDDTLFQRYQAQLRWCRKHLAAFRSQIKTLVHSSNGTAMFVQATPFHGQQLQQYHQRRNSSSLVASPLAKHMPQTIFTSQESISASRLRVNTTFSSKFHTTSNHSKHPDKRQYKGKTFSSSGMPRKDVRVYFNDPSIQKHLQDEKKFLTKHNLTYGINSTTSDSIDGDGETDSSFQCTAL